MEKRTEKSVRLCVTGTWLGVCVCVCVFKWFLDGGFLDICVLSGFWMVVFRMYVF